MKKINYTNNFLISIIFLVLNLLQTSLFAQEEKVSIQLKWYNQFQFAGFYIAKEKGFYKEKNIDVEIKEIDKTTNILNDVISGKSTYGIGSSSLLIDFNQNKPVVAIASILQHSPSVLLTTAKDIIKPEDFENKRLMISDNIYNSAQINALLKVHGINENKIILQKHSYNINDLINGNTDIYSAYITNEPFYLKQKNIDFNIFNATDYGFDFYGDILFTSQDEIKNHPNRVKAFYEATKKGWIWAFEHIDETAKIIFEKYNTKGKSLEHLIYEGNTLKDFAFTQKGDFGVISKRKFEEIAKLYQLLKLLPTNYSMENFIDPLQLTRKEMKIGVLAKRGDEKTLQRWKPLSDYLNSNQNLYHFEILPLDFEELEESVHKEEVDFVIVNTFYYVLLETHDGISRIATLLNKTENNLKGLKEFGGVIFTRKDNQNINDYKDLINRKFAAVDEKSFGGWIMGYYELYKNGIEKDDLKLSFNGTHDEVVKQVLNRKVDVGTVRSDTLEKMQREGLINLNDIKILGEKKYENFPYKISTDLYPEWPFSKLKNTNDEASKTVLTLILNIDENSEILKKMDIAGWSIPQDYSSVHRILKELEIAPYDNQKITLKKVFEQYKILIIFISIIALIAIQSSIMGIYKNRALKHYNTVLDIEVERQTRKLNNANKKLKKLAITDSLTGIYNHREFMILAKKYFDISKRNSMDLSVVSLDIDFFKKVNDTYGHQAGDKVLIELVKLINKNVRTSDVFGRLGGEEFSIILQNTSNIQAVNFSEKVRKLVENLEISYQDVNIKITISLGIATLKDEKDINKLMNNADIALYNAKNNGRNQVTTL